jgi:tRNA A-37 threonylcarbamoyl transferase component Bud32
MQRAVDPSVEHLYDEYLDAAMAGALPTPESFLRLRGVENAELLAVLTAVYQEHGKTRGTLGQAAGAGHGGVHDGAPKRTDVLGDFRLLERLGEGGMGVVFLAEQISLRRRVAIKLLRPEIASSATAAARFEREAMAAARLSHPSIVSVIAVGEHRGTRYIAMEHVQGRGLDEVLSEAKERGEPVAITRAVRWCGEIARGLAAAHEAGIIHRDVKPSNIRITTDDRAMLLDFGVARDLDSASPTLTETFIGSPFYAAPEQVAPRGGTIDGRTDVYAVGIVLYETITGICPFATGTLEQVLHAILTIDPSPPSAIRKAIPRDVTTAVMKAIDKEPARRYASASLLADDLDAILELRPIAATAPGPIDRVRRWGRRNKPAAAAIATGAAACVLVAGLIGVQAVRNQAAKRAEIRAIVAKAGESIGRYEQLRAEIDGNERTYRHIYDLRGAKYLTQDEDAQLDRAQAKVVESRREREQLFYAILDLANSAERAGAGTEVAESIRARAYLQRFFESELAGLPDEHVYRELVRQHDAEGTLDGVVRGSTLVSIESNVAGASVDIFRRGYVSQVVQGGERRQIATPLRGWPEGVVPGTWGLRIVKGIAELEIDDTILEIAGQPVRGSVFVLEELVSRGESAAIPAGSRLRMVDGVAVDDMYGVRKLMQEHAATPEAPHRYVFAVNGTDVTIEGESISNLGVVLGDAEAMAARGGVEVSAWKPALQGGSLTKLTLARAGAAETGDVLETRMTGVPLLASRTSRVDGEKLNAIELEPGDYAALIRAPGYEPLRVAFHASRGGVQKLSLELFKTGTAPEGFVRVVTANVTPPTWIMEREVTLGEYFAFLNDPETLAEIAASPMPIRYPTNGEEATGQRGADGKFLIPEGWDEQWPALHISWNDAVAYAAWKTRRAAADGKHYVFTLPSLDQWVDAAGAMTGGQFPFGDSFHPKWMSSCFARPRPYPERVRSFAIDESIFGVFDMAGSISEWTSTRWQEHQPHMRHAGGSWATGDATQFYIYGGNGMLPDRDTGFIGFRLIMEMKTP